MILTGTNSFMEQQYRSSSTIVSTNQHQGTMHTHNYQHIHTQNYRSTHKQQQRPPLPDYQEATQRARQIHQGRRTGLSTQTMGYYNEVGVGEFTAECTSMALYGPVRPYRSTNVYGPTYA